MNSPKISIVIPVYNTEHLLLKCLDSVVNQTYKNIEIIVVDDFSPNNCEEIVQQYQVKDSRVSYHRHPKNLGLLKARHSGVELATGDYVLPLDSDDYFDVKLCQHLVNHLKKNPSDIIQFRLIAKCGNKLVQREHVQGVYLGKEVFKNLMVDVAEITWNACGKLYKKELLSKALNEYPITAKVVNGEDYYINYLAFYFSQHYSFCSKAIYYYYIHDSESRKKKMSKESQDSYIKNMEFIYKNLNDFKQKYEINTQYPVIKNEKLMDFYTFQQLFLIFSTEDQADYLIKFYEMIGPKRVCAVLQDVIGIEGNYEWAYFGTLSRIEKIKWLIKYVLKKLLPKRVIQLFKSRIKS